MSAADTLVVTWTGTPGEFENTIMADTSADGTQAHDVYMLESNKVYLQQSTLILNSSCEVIGAPYAEGSRPAEIKPILGADGASSLMLTGLLVILRHTEMTRPTSHNLYLMVCLLVLVELYMVFL